MSGALAEKEGPWWRFTHRLPSRFVPVAMRMCLRVAGKRWNGKYTPSLEASAIALIAFPGSTFENSFSG